MSLENDRARGAQAKTLLDNEMLQESYDRQEQDLIHFWRNDAKTPQEREATWHLLQGVIGARDILKSIHIKGNNAQKAIERKVKEQAKK